MSSGHDGRYPGHIKLFDSSGKSTGGYQDDLAMKFVPGLGMHIPRLEPAPSSGFYAYGAGPHIFLPVLAAGVLNALITEGRQGTRSDRVVGSMRMDGEYLGSVELVLGLIARDAMPQSQRVRALELKLAEMDGCIELCIQAELAEPDIRFDRGYKPSSRLEVKVTVKDHERAELGLSLAMPKDD